MGDDIANKENHGIAAQTNQNDGERGAEHSTNQKYENQQPVEQHEKSKKANQATKRRATTEIDPHGLWSHQSGLHQGEQDSQSNELPHDG